MHDLSLGPPVSMGTNPNAKHSGPCYDGVYGCHHCHNAAENGKGAICQCSICGDEKHTKIRQAYDERVLYAYCADCWFNHVHSFAFLFLLFLRISSGPEVNRGGGRTGKP